MISYYKWSCQPNDAWAQCLVRPHPSRKCPWHRADVTRIAPPIPEMPMQDVTPTYVTRFLCALLTSGARSARPTICMQGLVGELCCSITFINFCFQATLIFFMFHLSSLLHSPHRIFSAIVSSWLTALPDCETMVPQLVKSTTSVYTTITTELLPTPAKSHYTFNLRDLSKVFQGMLMVQSGRVKVGILTGQSSGFSYGAHGGTSPQYPF